jgi:hypothetical protein
MFVHGERIALTLEDGSALFFDFSDAWRGHYVLDASASPARIVEEAKTAASYNNYCVVSDEDLKLFFGINDGLEVNESVVLCVGSYKPDAETPHYSWSSTFTLSGGVVVSASIV